MLGNFKDEKGFSMIELMVALVIIGILSTVGFINYQQQVRKSRDARRKSDLEAIRGALEIYKADNDAYPAEHDCDSSLGHCSPDCASCVSGLSTDDWTDDGGMSDDIPELEPNYIADLPVDPVNNTDHFYEYQAVCNESEEVCGNTIDCTTVGNCCAYELSVSLETETDTYRLCNP